MKNSAELEARINQISEKISESEISPEFVELSGLFNERSQLVQQITKLKWEQLSLSQKIEKRKNDLLTTEKYFEKFKGEIECVYLFKKLYTELIDTILVRSINSSYLSILLQSLNTSLYVSLGNKDYNLDFIIAELKSEEQDTGIQMVINSYTQLLDHYHRNSKELDRRL